MKKKSDWENVRKLGLFSGHCSRAQRWSYKFFHQLGGFFHVIFGVPFFIWMFLDNYCSFLLGCYYCWVMVIFVEKSFNHGRWILYISPFNFPTSGIRDKLWELFYLKKIEMEGNLTTMVKLNKSNWAMWMSMMENFLTIKDLSDILEGEKARPKDISDLEWNKMKKKKCNCLH